MSARQLHLGVKLIEEPSKRPPSFDLPPEAMLQRFGILAMSGAGKSNTAVVMAEEMYDSDIPWVAIDPKGDWWGVRSSKSGKGPGLNVPIFGGLHGDVPLEETAGALVAELIAERRLTSVLDISEMAKGAQLRFLTEFAEVLLRKNRAPLQVIAEEADEYLPQRVMKREAQCVGAWSKLVKRGRFRGIFVTLVTQRSAALSKDALSQIDTLVPMRVGDPRDKKALRESVVEHDIGQEMFDSLPRLEDGEGWVWSPHKLKLMERVRFRRRRTFDSGATPDWESRQAARLADVDLGEIESAMQETVDRAKADDPRELRKQIKGLERDLAKAAKAGAPPAPEPDVVEVPVLANGAAERLQDAVAAVRSVAGDLAKVAEEVGAGLAEVRGARSVAQRPARPTAQRTPERASAQPKPPPTATDSEIKLKPGARRMLAALAQLHPTPLTKGQITTLANVKPGGTFSGYLSNLRVAGLIVDEPDGAVALSPAGEREMADEMGSAPPSPEELIAMWSRKLKPGAQRMLRVLFGSYSDALSRDDLAELAEVKPGGTFSGYLSNLRVAGLVEDVGQEVRASETLFIGEAP